MFLPREKNLTCLIDFYRPFKSGAHTRFLSTQNPAESAISSDLSKKQKDFLLHSSLFRGRGVVLPERKAAKEPASECRPTRAGDLAGELAGESWLAGWLAGWLSGELGFASPKNLAFFPIFGDFLLRSYINSSLIFENCLIIVSTGSVLRKIA